VRPNHVTASSLALALLSGLLLWRSTREAALLAAAALFFANVLDCADGQLARLQQSSSPLGYLFDGIADYAGLTAVFCGMAHALETGPATGVRWWWVASLAGASMVWHCLFVDAMRERWMGVVYGKSSAGSKRPAVYRVYRAVAVGIAPVGSDAAAPGPEELASWIERHRGALRMSLWIGPTTHVTAIVLAALCNRPDWYFWAAIFAGNAWMLLTRAAVRRADAAAPALA
jgi:phosphatidylglycerophosphate synthase